MEKRISELMDDLYDGTAEPCPDDFASTQRIKEATMRKIENSINSGRAVKNKKIKTLGSVAIAAALLVTLSGVALATNAFGVADYFRDYFGSIDAEQAEVLENISAISPAPVTLSGDEETGETATLGRASVLAPVTSNGTTMTPLAAIADEHFLYLALKIEAPEGTVLSPNTEGTQPGPDGGYYQLFGDGADERFEIVFDESLYVIRGYAPEWTWQDEQPGDNVISCVIRITAQMQYNEFERAMKWNDGVPKTIRIPGLWSQSPDKEYTQILEGLWEFEIGDFGVIAPVEFNVAGLETYYYFEKEPGIEYRVEITEGLHESEEYKITLESMVISPLGIRVSYSSAYNEDMVVGPGVFRLVMKDGSRINASGMAMGSSYAPDEKKETMYVDALFGFEAPIVFADIDHIQFGGLIIPME